MTDNKDLTTRPSTSAGTRGGQTSEPEVVLLPPVDICEDAEGITLTADMPGVSKDELSIHIDRDALQLAAEARFDVPDAMQPLYADVRSTRYRREFSLSAELDSDRIEANLKDGVLTLRIPKREEHRPRKIQILAE